MDTISGTTLLLGKGNATKVEIADGSVITEVQGDLNVLEDLVVTGTITATGGIVAGHIDGSSNTTNVGTNDAGTGLNDLNIGSNRMFYAQFTAYNGTATTYTITHDVGNTDYMVFVSCGNGTFSEQVSWSIETRSSTTFTFRLKGLSGSDLDEDFQFLIQEYTDSGTPSWT